MLCGWERIDGKWYYFNPSHNGHFGAMMTGWLTWSGKRYYLMPGTGEMLCNEKRTIGGNIYSFDEEGAVQTGWFKEPEGYYRYADGNGVLLHDRWIYSNGNYYYLEGYVMANNKRLTVNGVEYYFYPGGIMGTGWIHLGGGDYYYAASSGALRGNYLLRYNGALYYLKSDFLMARNETLTIDGTRYTFDNSGRGSVSKATVPLDNQSRVNYILQASGRCLDAALAMGANLVEGANNSDGTHFTYRAFKGTDGNTYDAVAKSAKSVSEVERAIASSLNAGLPVVVTVNSNLGGVHYLLVVGSGYNPSIGANDYYVIDPGYVGKTFPSKGSSAKVYDTTLSAASVFMKDISIGSGSSFRYSVQASNYYVFEKR